jgi:hypothetical protein
MMATGRYRRFGALPMGFDNARGQRWWVDKAPKIISYVIKDQKLPTRKERNGEVAKLVKADQDAREKQWDFNDHAAMMKYMNEDRKRMSRIKELVNKGALYTAEDFSDAGLVCQHGGTFTDYMLAHELAVCSLLLGNKQAAWLCAAAYDRMLCSASYPQRFATQMDGNLNLRPVDSNGINERMRKIVVGRTLQEMRDRIRGKARPG